MRGRLISMTIGAALGAASLPARAAAQEPGQPISAPSTRDWDRTDRRLRWGMGAAGVPIVVGASLITTGLFGSTECFVNCEGTAARGLLGTGTALTLAGIAGISALAGLRGRARRTRSWSDGDSEGDYRRSRLMAGLGIGAGAGLSVMVAGAIVTPIPICVQDQCGNGRPWLIPTIIGGTVLAAGLTGLGVVAFQRRRHRRHRAQVMFTGTGIAGRF